MDVGQRHKLYCLLHVFAGAHPIRSDKCAQKEEWLF